MGDDIQLNRDYIIQVVQDIVNFAHTNSHPAKKVLNIGPEDIAFADPIGGDSKKNPHEKRCHLYWNSMMVISYDDEGLKMPFINFCEKFNIKVDAEQRMAIYNHIDNHIDFKDYEEDYIMELFDDMIHIDDLKREFNSGEHQLVNLKEITKGSAQWYYLTDRSITKYDNIYQADFYTNSEWKQPVIVILNRRGDRVLGIQVRNLKAGIKRMFKIYNYEKLLEVVSPQLIESFNINKLVMYNKLSYLFNILNIDFNKKVTIFEGYLDSIFYPNSIGVTGVNAETEFLEDNNLDIQYFYDNDKAGWVKSDEKINKGYPVFLWGKMIEEIVNIKNPKDPHDLKYKMGKVKDLNQLVQLNSKLPLHKWFSRDTFDKRYIPLVKKKFVSYTKYKKKQ